MRKAKNEFAKKEEELTRAFTRVESLLEELNNLQKREVSSSKDNQKQEAELEKLRLQLEVSCVIFINFVVWIVSFVCLSLFL